MNQNELYKSLMSFDGCHDLCAALTDEQIDRFEATNGIELPQSLKELYGHFDGGEIFIPGTVIYGLMPSEKRKKLREANAGSLRDKFSILRNYLIVAKLNYGDFICVNLNPPYDVIQWDHENDTQFCTWTGIDEWLNDTIEAYKEYEAGVD